MVTRFGMDETVGPVSYVDDPRVLWSDDAALPRSHAGPATARHVDAAVLGLLRRAQDRATSILTLNRGVLERCVRELLEDEVLDESDLQRLTAERRRPEVLREATLALA